MRTSFSLFGLRGGLQAGLVLAIGMGTARLAHAQSDQDTASARAAATAGAQAFEAGNWKRAIDYFERAEALIHSPVHLWYLASASAKVGKLVAAQEKCNKVQREGVAPGASAGLVNAYEGCVDLLEDLESRVPTISLEVSGLPEGAEFEVTRNGVKIASATVGVAVPADPGSYSFEGRADGFRATSSVTVSEGQHKIVVLTFSADPNVRIHKAEPKPVLDGGTQSVKMNDTPPPEPQFRRRGPPIGSYLSWVLGAGAAGAGVGFTVLALDSGRAIDGMCGGNRSACKIDNTDPDEYDANLVRLTQLKADEQAFYVLSAVGYGVGGLGIVGGFLIWALQPSNTTARPTPQFQITPVLGFQHIGVAGRF
jgi:hypothetical protein